MRKISGSLILPALISIIVLISLLVQASNAQSMEPRYGGTLVGALDANPAYLNPALGTSVTNSHPGVQMFNSLVDFDVKNNPIPDMAKSWEISQDGLTYTFHLWPNVKWHDGVDFSSADVKFTYETLLAVGAGKTTLAAIKSIETPDRDTVVFKLSYPFAPLLQFLGKYWGSIIPKHLLEGKDIFKANEYNRAPVGTGPFKFVEWVQGQRIVLERNKDYFKPGLPYLDRVVISIIPSATTQIAALEKGELDVMIKFREWSEWERLTKTKGIAGAMVNYAGSAVWCAYYNLRHPILSNKKVRQAFAYATNRTLAIELATRGLGTVSTGPIGPSSWAFNPDVRQYPYDLAKANQLLDEAGYPRGADGQRFKITIDTQNAADYLRLCETMRDGLKNVGVTLNIQTMDMAAITDKTYMRFDYEISIMNNIYGPDPSRLASHWHSSNIRPGWLLNVAGYNNSRVDFLFDEALKVVDRAKRAQYYKEIQSILVEDQPAIWFGESPGGFLYRQEFHGFPHGPWIYYDSYEKIWWEGGQPRATTTIPTTTKVTAVGGTSSELVMGAVITAVVVIGAIGYYAMRKRRQST